MAGFKDPLRMLGGLVAIAGGVTALAGAAAVSSTTVALATVILAVAAAVEMIHSAVYKRPGKPGAAKAGNSSSQNVCPSHH